MKKVNKVSINSISFTLEEGAYETLSTYLNALKNHYEGNPNASEIIDGIEARIAELLFDKVGKDGVANEAQVDEIIGIIGKPEENFGDSDSNGGKKRSIKRKLYRNPDDKRIAGVLGGISAYFHIDSVWPRLGFAAVIASSIFAECDYFNPGVLCLLYLIFAICMPMAKTNMQKCEMRGEELSCNGIEKTVGGRTHNGCSSKCSDAVSVFGKSVIIIIGFTLALVGIGGIIAVFCALAGLAIAGFALPDIFSSFLSATGTFPEWAIFMTKVCTALVVFLPCVALIYAGIRMVFPIKSPKCKPGLILLIIWLLAIAGLSVMSVKASKNFWNSEKAMVSESLNLSGDTLYVKLVDVNYWNSNPVLAEGDFDDYMLVYFDMKEKKAMKVAAYPSIDLNRNNYCEPSIEIDSEIFTGTMNAGQKAEAKRLNYYRMEGDTLYLSPVIYGGKDGIHQTEVKIDLNLPSRIKIMIDGPYPHDFDQEFKFTNLPERIFDK